MSGAPEAWDAAVAAWAARRTDLRALVQIGSRVQPGDRADRWSDYDYQLVTTRPGLYLDASFCRQLGDCWSSSCEGAFGGVPKVNAVFAGGLEADFAILRHAPVRLAFLALRFPSTRPLWPRRLRAGVLDLAVIAGPGWRVVKGGPAWERRYRRLPAARPTLGAGEFAATCGEFWTHAVWAAKRAQRGELRAAQRAIHQHLLECALRVFREEALIEGRAAEPLGRRAEGWLGEGARAATAEGTRPERAALLRACLGLAQAFAASSARVASARGWPAADTGRLEAWLAAACAVPP